MSIAKALQLSGKSTTLTLQKHCFYIAKRMQLQP
jgi:hypothetical protein